MYYHFQGFEVGRLQLWVAARLLTAVDDLLVALEDDPPNNVQSASLQFNIHLRTIIT